LGRTYQIPQPFGKMSVFENLLVAAVHGGGLRERQARSEIHDNLERIGWFAKKNAVAGGMSRAGPKG